MGKAEVGSTKHLSNNLKSKGLQRLRWFCQVCEKQCRDENGFKMHAQSESHVRQILVVGEDPQKFISRYSDEFARDFVTLLRTAHGTKQVQINRFYQEYISNKEHVHMNATRWPSLTEFAKHLGKEGICRVEDLDGKGIFVRWIDNSPDALRRQEQLRRREMMEKGDEERERIIIGEQIRRARREKGLDGQDGDGHEEEEEGAEEERERTRELRREEGKKVVLAFGGKKDKEKEEPPFKAAAALGDEKMDGEKKTLAETKAAEISKDTTTTTTGGKPADAAAAAKTLPTTTGAGAHGSKPTVAIKMGAVKPQAKNVFKQASKKAAFGGGSKKMSNSSSSSKDGGREPPPPPKKMSEAERIMREELERKRTRTRDAAPGLGFGFGFGGGKEPGSKRLRRF